MPSKGCRRQTKHFFSSTNTKKFPTDKKSRKKGQGSAVRHWKSSYSMREKLSPLDPKNLPVWVPPSPSIHVLDMKMLSSIRTRPRNNIFLYEKWGGWASSAPFPGTDAYAHNNEKHAYFWHATSSIGESPKSFRLFLAFKNFDKKVCNDFFFLNELGLSEYKFTSTYLLAIYVLTCYLLFFQKHSQLVLLHLSPMKCTYIPSERIVITALLIFRLDKW